MRHASLVGIDISDSSIKVLQLDQEGNVVAFGKGELPSGVVVYGSINDKEVFATVLNEILTHTKPNALYEEHSVLRAAVCLPESKIFTHYLSVPDTVTKRTIEEYVRNDAEKIVPFALTDMYWDYHVSEKNGIRNATFVGVKKHDLDNYIEALTYANVKPAFVSGGLFSLGSALFPEGALTETSLIVDIGMHTTTIGVFCDDASAIASIQVSIGGEHFTRMLSEKLSVPLTEAEALKQTYGLTPQKEQPRVPKVLRECILEITNKIKEVTEYIEGKTQNRVSQSIITGGSALLPGIAPFLESETGIKTRIADPLQKIKNHDVLANDASAIFFANVIGLALCGINTDSSRINLLTQYRYDDRTDDKERIGVRDIQSLSDLRYAVYTVWTTVDAYILHGVTYVKKMVHIDIKIALSIVLTVCAILFLAWVVMKYL